MKMEQEREWSPVDSKLLRAEDAYHLIPLSEEEHGDDDIVDLVLVAG
jgi:hypothetical protein